MVAKRRKSKTQPEAPAEEEPRVRERMIAGAARLLATRGLQGTSFSEVLAETGAPRGSVYHHFPGGKDQLVKAALDFVEAQMDAVMSAKRPASAEKTAAAFLQVWRTVLVRSELRSGCAVMAVTVAADSDDLLDHVATIFRRWRARLAEMFVAGGLGASDAAAFASTLIAAAEGAVVLSRGERSLEPFELVAGQMMDLAKRLAKRR